VQVIENAVESVSFVTATRRSPPQAPEPVATPATAVAAPPVETPSDLYARAEQALAAGDHDGGEKLLGELAARFPTSPQAASALFDLATLARTRHDIVAARAYLGRLDDAPSALREPAAYIACRLDVDAGDGAAAARCFNSFRARFPSSPHDEEVLAWLAGHAQDLAGCASARELASEYLRRYPHGAFAERARHCTEAR
jgi:outer membrane protein assembly factor BamD (BamD/ComL family)